MFRKGHPALSQGMLNTFFEGLRDLLLFPKDPLPLKSTLSQVRSVKQDVTPPCFRPLAVTSLDCREADWIPAKVLLLDHDVFSPGRATLVAAVAVGCYPATTNPTAYLVGENDGLRMSSAFVLTGVAQNTGLLAKAGWAFGFVIIQMGTLLLWSSKLQPPFQCRWRCLFIANRESI